MAEQIPQLPQLYTIGHSNLSIDDFTGLLKENYIHVLVDVRSQPYSRFNPQYNRESLKHAMAYANIDYVFAGDSLGGRPDDPTCYTGGAAPAGRADYLKEVDYAEVMQRDWYQRGIERLIEIAAKRRTAIMCSEEDPIKCHRHHLVTQTLLKRDVTVWHIRADKRVEQAQLLPDKPEAQQLSLF